MTATMEGVERRQFSIKVLGKTLEHLGVQMYKRRDAAIAELVANCWDAGAENVEIVLPAEASYNRDTSVLTITDDGGGMTPDQVDEDYLVVGRNRRAAAGRYAGDRKVMGRKGIGKLAGFGIAHRVRMITWTDGRSTTFELDAAKLKREAGQVGDVPIEGLLGPIPADAPGPTGTRVELMELKHATPMDARDLRESLARRFSRSIRGRMRITVNGNEVGEPGLDLEYREPPEGLQEEDLGDGQVVRW